MPSLLEGILELRDLVSHILNSGADRGGWLSCIPLRLASRSRWEGRLQPPNDLARFCERHWLNHPKAWSHRILRRRVRGDQGRMRRLPHVGLRWPEKTRVCLSCPGGDCRAHAFRGGRRAGAGLGVGSVNAGPFWRALPWAGNGSACGDVWSPFWTQAQHLQICGSGGAGSKKGNGNEW